MSSLYYHSPPSGYCGQEFKNPSASPQQIIAQMQQRDEAVAKQRAAGAILGACQPSTDADVYRSPMAAEMDRLFNVSEYLSSLISRLESRLDAVLTPMEPEGAGIGAVHPSPPQAPMVRGLAELARQHDTSVSRIESLIVRLAV